MLAKDVDTLALLTGTRPAGAPEPASPVDVDVEDGFEPPPVATEVDVRVRGQAGVEVGFQRLAARARSASRAREYRPGGDPLDPSGGTCGTRGRPGRAGRGPGRDATACGTAAEGAFRPEGRVQPLGRGADASAPTRRARILVAGEAAALRPAKRLSRPRTRGVPSRADRLAVFTGPAPVETSVAAPARGDHVETPPHRGETTAPGPALARSTEAA